MLLADTAQIRKSDEIMIREYGFPGLLLMESAGRKTAAFILQKYPERQNFLILTGPGNNGGDGWVIGRYLILAGKSVKFLSSGDPAKLSGDAAINFKALQGCAPKIEIWQGSESHDFPSDSVLIDALLGTGITSELRGSIAEMVEFFRERKMECVAVDLPSGLNASSGKTISRPIPAQFTCTFHLPKICHFTTPAAGFCGETIVVDIGMWPQVNEKLQIHRQLITGEFIRRHWQSRQSNTHKGTFGHTLFIGGSRNMPGAIALSARTALFIGAGLSSALIPFSARNPLFETGAAEVMTLNIGDENTHFLNGNAVEEALEAVEGKNAIAIGPGLGNNEETQEFLGGFLKGLKVKAPNLPVVIDADGLNILAERPDFREWLPETCVFTPHPGEMKRLASEPDPIRSRLEAAESLAAQWQCIVVLKGAHTLIALPNGDTMINTTGNAGMATAGSGDVLTGAITGLLAQGYSAAFAAAGGVFLHGLAGDLLAGKVGQEGVTAVGIMEHLSPAIQHSLQSQTQQIPQI